MLEDLMQQELFSLAELNHLRDEAMSLFEYCLTNGEEAALVEFIEAQLAHEPPRLQLLRDLADDLQQRLLSLREYHFDVRDRVVRTFKENYQVDLTPITSPDALDAYHHLTTDAILSFACEHAQINDEDVPLLRKMIDASLQMAAQLHGDILLTVRVHTMVVDWLNGMSAVVARRYWNDISPSDSKHQNYH